MKPEDAGLVWEPTESEGSVEAPFYSQLIARGERNPLYKTIERFVYKEYAHPEQALQMAGVRGEDVDYIREATALPGIELILRVDCEVRAGGSVVRQETRYFIASLSADEVSPEQLMRWVRGHWCVEIPQSDCPQSDNLCVAGRAGYHHRGGLARAGLVA